MRYTQYNRDEETEIKIMVHDHDLDKLNMNKTEVAEIYELINSEKLSDRMYSLYKLSLKFESDGIYTAVTNIDQPPEERDE